MFGQRWQQYGQKYGRYGVLCLVIVGVAALGWQHYLAQAANPGTAFSYQGQLVLDGAAVTDTCAFQFGLWDASSNGTQVGSTVEKTGVAVADGYFTTMLDFGSAVFGGEPRYLQIAVQCSGDSSYTTLAGRVELSAVPYAQAVPWGGIFNRPANLIYVATSGGDFQSIGAALTAVSNGDSGADGYTDASASNPYTLKLAPGTYTEQVTMVEYVDIEGAGEGTTTIRYTGSGAYDSSSATVIGAANAELRFLTVESDGTGNAYAIALYNESAGVRATNVALTTLSGSGDSHGVLNVNGGTAILNDVTITAHGADGVLNVVGSIIELNDVTISASGSFGVSNDCGSTTATATLTNVRITMSDGTYGVSNTCGTMTLTDIAVTLSGSGQNYALFNNDGTMTVSNATLSVSDGDKNHGIFNATTVTLNNVTATASGGSESYGMYHYGGTTTIRDSALSGDTASIYSHPGGNIRIANTLLDGPTNGTMTCVGAYDETFAALGTNCQ